MPTLLEIRNDPNYINANAATKQAIFDKYSAGDKDYTTANEATRNAIQQRFGLSLAEEPEPEEEPGFGKMMGSAVKRGAMQTGSLLADVLPALAAKTVGADDYAKRQMEEAAATQQEIQEKYPARYPTLGDVKGPSDYLPFAAETGAEQLSNLAAALIPGIGGGMLAARGLTGAAAATATRAGQLGGAYLGSFALNTPEVFQNIYEETGQMAPGASVIAGSVAGALDSIFPAYIMKQFTPGMKMGVVEKILEKSGMKPGMIRAALAGGITGVATEGPTEAGQEAISIMAEKFVGDNKDVWGSKEFNRLVESGVRGAVAGGGISGVTGGVSGIGAKGREEERKAALERIDALQNEIQTSHDQEAEKDPELYRKSTGKGVVLGEVEAQEGLTPEQQHYFDQQHIDILQKALASGELLSTEEINKLNIIKRREDEYYAAQATPDIASATEEVTPKPLEVVEGQEQRRPEFALQPSNVPQQTIPQGTEQGAPPIVNKAQGDLFEDQQGLTSFEQGYTPPQSIYTPPQTPAPGPIQVPGQETPTELTPEQQKFFGEKRGQSGVEEQQQQKLARLQELHNDRQRGVLPSQQDLQDFKALTAELPEFKPAFVIDPSTTANLGINKNAVIVRGENSIIGEDISDPVAAKRVAAQLKKHAINPRVAPEVKSNITEFLKRPEFQEAPSDTVQASAEPVVGPTDGGVPVPTESVIPTPTSAEATDTRGVVSGAGYAGIPPVGKVTKPSALEKEAKKELEAKLEAESEAIQEQAEAELEAELEAESEAIQEQAEAEVDAGPIGQAIAKIEDGDLETKAQVRSFVNKLEKNGVLDDVEDVREGLSDREQSADDVLGEVSGLLDEARDNAVQELVDERQREADDKREAATKPKPAPKKLLTEDEQYERDERIKAAKEKALGGVPLKKVSADSEQDIKDAEGNDNLYRNAPEGTQGIQAVDVKKAVDAISAKWANAPDSSVVQSISELPAHVQARLDKGVTPKGIFDPRTNRVYLIADNITDARDTAITIAHEALGHYGIRAVLGSKYKGVMNNIYDTNPTVQRAANAKIKQGLDKATAVEEALADMQGDRAVQSVWQQLKNVVRQFLQRIGVTSPTDKEVNELLGRAKDFVVKGVGKGRGRQLGGDEVLASAKVDRMKATGSSKAWILFSEASKGINFANIKTLEQAEKAAEEHYKEQIKNIPEFDGKAYMEGLTIDDINAYPPDIQHAIQEYKTGNKSKGIQEILDTVASQRKANLKEWKNYLENINPAMEKDPFWRDYVITSLLKSMRTDKPDTGLPLNANALGQLYQKFKQGENINFGKGYKSALVDATKDLVELGDATTGWRKIPQTDKNDPKFDERVAAVQSLSCTGWCTRSTMAAPYIQQGDFWVYVDDKKPQVAIRFKGDQVQEIQGPQNDRSIPTKYINEITSLVDSGKIKNMTGKTKGDITKAVRKSQFEAMIKERLASGELVEKDRGYAKKNGIELDKWYYAEQGTKVYVDADGGIVVNDDVTISEAAPNLTTVGGDASIYEWGSAPALTTVGGNAYIYEGASVPNLTTVGGFASIYDSASVPNLTTVGSDALLGEGASAPALTTMGGNAGIYGSAPALTTVGGDADINEGANVPKLTTVGGDARIYEGASIPNLTTVGGNASISEGANAPKLTTVGGDASIYKGASAPALTAVGGDAYINGSAPALTTVGGEAVIYSSVPNLRRIGIGKEAALKGTPLDPNKATDKLLYSNKKDTTLDEEIPYDEKPEVNMEIPKSNKPIEDRIFDIPNMPEGIKSALFNTVVNVKDWATRTGYALAFGRDLADMIGNIIPSAKDYFKMMEAKEAVRTHYEGEIDAITSRAYQVKDLDELQSFLQESTTSQKWGFVPEWTGAAVVDPDMEAKFNELTPEAQQVAIDIFKHGSESRKEMQRLVTEDTEAAFKQELEGASKKEAVEINARRANIINMYSGGELQGPYAPLARFGNFVTIAKSKEYVEHERNASLKDYEWIRNHRGDPEHYIVEFSDSLGTATYRAKSMEKELNEKHPNAGWSTEASARQTQAKGVTEAPWSAFRRLKTMINAEESMGGKYALNPKDASKARKHIDQLLTDLYLTTLAETSARKHDLKRENVAGASKDMIRAFVSKGRADAHFIAALKSNGEITDVIQKMRDESKKDEGGSRAAKIRALNEILIRHSLGMQYIETPIQDKLMQFNSIWTLLTKPAYYFQNLTQPWMMSVPVMGRHEGVGEMKAVKALMEAYGQLAPAFGREGFLKGFTSGKFDIDSLPITVTRDEKDMLKRLKDQGILDVGISRDLGYWESRGGMTGPIVEAMHKMNTWVRQVETINRVTTALASYRLVGGGPKGEIEASHVINTTHGNYSATNAPRLWSMVPKGAGNLILQFRKFQFIQASLIIRLATTSMIGKDAKQKAASRRALAWTLAHYGVMTGVQGLPAMAVIGYFAAAALGEDDEPVNAERWFTENVAGGDKEIAKLLWHGAPSLVGLDLTGMLGAQNMLSILPFTDVNLAERGGYEAAVLGLMGSFIGGTVNNGAEGVNLMMKGDYYKGLEKMLPSGFSKAAQSYRLSSEGYTNSKGDLLMDPEEFTGLIVLAQALGLRTGKVADIQKRTGQVIEFDRYYKSRTSEITHRYTKAAKDGDSEEMYRLRDEFRELQDSKRRNGIKPQPITNLTQAVKEQRKRERGTVEGVQTTKATRRFVTEGAED